MVTSNTSQTASKAFRFQLPAEGHNQKFITHQKLQDSPKVYETS